MWSDAQLDEDQISQNVQLTMAVFATLQTEMRLTGFWNSIPAQNKLKEELRNTMLSQDFYKLPGMMQKYSEIISRILEVARTNHRYIINA